MTTQYLVFTDMDGTLLDHHTYSHAAALKTLDTLRQARIPVIPTTSKTFEEMEVLRNQIDLAGPFIVENGAAIHIPHGFMRQKPANTQWIANYWVRQFCSKKHYWLTLINRIKPDFEGEFTHFTEMSIEQICDATGLSEEEARRAADRRYGEPVMWLGSESRKQDFIHAMIGVGAKPLQGGRFIHISGDCDKGAALQWMVREFARQYPELDCQSIALGDGQNDVAMLEVADYAVRIRSPNHPVPELQKTQQVFTSTHFGPEGWSEMLDNLITSHL